MFTASNALSAVRNQEYSKWMNRELHCTCACAYNERHSHVFFMPMGLFSRLYRDVLISNVLKSRVEYTLHYCNLSVSSVDVWMDYSSCQSIAQYSKKLVALDLSSCPLISDAALSSLRCLRRSAFQSYSMFESIILTSTRTSKQQLYYTLCIILKQHWLHLPRAFECQLVQSNQWYGPRSAQHRAVRSPPTHSLPQWNEFGSLWMYSYSCKFIVVLCHRFRKYDPFTLHCTPIAISYCTRRNVGLVLREPDQVAQFNEPSAPCAGNRSGTRRDRSEMPTAHCSRHPEVHCMLSSLAILFTFVLLL